MVAPLSSDLKLEEKMSSINHNHNKPDTYDGDRDCLTVNTCLYTIEQYLNLSQLSVPYIIISEHNTIAIASSHFKGNAAVRCYNIVNAPTVPTSSESFKTLLTAEFILADHKQRAIDKLRNLQQTGSVEKCFSAYRNVILMLGSINEREMIYRSNDRLKYHFRVEVVNANCS